MGTVLFVTLSAASITIMYCIPFSANSYSNDL